MISKLFGKEDDFAWRDVFFQENFSVDKFLSKNTNKSDLVSLRQGLKKYGSDLHKCMSEILKNETEAIVSLAEALSNLTTKIDDLSKPASQLQEEVRALHEAIKSAKQNIDEHIKKTKSIEDKRTFLSINNNIITSCISVEQILEIIQENENKEVDLLVLERAVSEYSFQKTYSQSKGFFTQNDTVNIVERKLNKVLDDAFLNALLKEQTKINQNTKLERCLRMYVQLNRQNEAENLYKEKYIRGLIQDIFTQKNFDLNSQDLSKLYNQAFQVLDENMANILTIVKTNRDLKGYNFIVNSFWKEIDKLLRENLPYITAPGNPELFQKRFTTTWQFLNQLSTKCENPNIIKTQETFQNHIKRYNLPVYFEIRFQQIAARLEKDLISLEKQGNLNSQDNKINKTLKLKLKASETFYSCFEECFKKDVFIEHLSSQFIKLSMLLLSRYLRWLEHILSTQNNTHNLEEFSVFALMDLENLKFKEKLNNMTVLSNIKSLIPSIISSNDAAIDETCFKFQANLIRSKLNESLDKLQEVTAVPRLYRRTNRSIPTEPSQYMITAIQPIVKFNSNYGKQLPILRINTILNELIAKLCENYLSLVQEVLHSVGKTEKSLARLKNRNAMTSNSKDNKTTTTTSDLNSDEGKIREQIRLDVEYFSTKLRPLTNDEKTKIAIANLTTELLKSAT